MSNDTPAMADTMIERVAKKIGETYDGECDPITTPSNWARAMEATRAAIAAMREPTEAMIAVAEEHEPGIGVPSIYSDMIDEALK